MTVNHTLSSTKENFLTSDHIKTQIEGKLNDDELSKALMEDMKPNSAPGIDGFTVKFIKAFWDSLRPLLREAVNSMNSKGTMSSTLRIAIIKLLLKSGKDPTSPCSFRGKFTECS